MWVWSTVVGIELSKARPTAMPYWDADLQLQWPPNYTALIHVYAYLFSAVTLALLFCSVTRKPNHHFTHAAGISALCSAAMIIRAVRYEWFIAARILDIWSAEACLSMCMQLLYNYIMILECASRRTWRFRSRLVRYMRWSYLAWTASALTAFHRPSYTIMYLVLCLQWGVYALCLNMLQMHAQAMLYPKHGSLTPPKRVQPRMPLVSIWLDMSSFFSWPSSLSLTRETVRQLYDVLCVIMLMCVQLMFLVICSYAEELRDFHAWIIHTTRLFSVVFLLLLMTPGFLPRFQASRYTSSLLNA